MGSEMCIRDRPLTMQDLQGRILRRRRRQQVAEPLRLDVSQRCAASAMRARWRCSAGSAVRAVWILEITAHTVTVIFPYSRRRAKGTSRDPNRKVRTAYQSIANDVSSTTVYIGRGSFRRSTIFQKIPKFNTAYGFSIRMACIEPHEWTTRTREGQRGNAGFSADTHAARGRGAERHQLPLPVLPQQPAQ